MSGLATKRQKLWKALRALSVGQAAFNTHCNVIETTPSKGCVGTLKK